MPLRNLIWRDFDGDDVSRLFHGRGEADSFVGAATALSEDLRRVASHARLKQIRNKAMPPEADRDSLARLRNVGKAALADFSLLGVTSISQLADQDADSLYIRLCQATGRRHDPCVHDVFAAAIHQAKTGEALDWWAFTKTRKARGDFPLK